MSYLVVGKVYGDVATFRKALDERADEYRAIAEKAKANGAIHHRFGVGPDHIVVTDEWETVEQFQTFFGDPELQAFIAANGGDPGREPEFWITQAISSPDQF